VHFLKPIGLSETNASIFLRIIKEKHKPSFWVPSQERKNIELRGFESNSTYLNTLLLYGPSQNFVHVAIPTPLFLKIMLNLGRDSVPLVSEDRDRCMIWAPTIHWSKYTETHY